MIIVKFHTIHNLICYNYNRASGRKQTAHSDVDYPPFVTAARCHSLVADYGSDGTARSVQGTRKARRPSKGINPNRPYPVVVDLVGGGPNKTACPGSGITAPLRRCNVWSIPSMADGQGRALGSGSIPDASSSAAKQIPNTFFETSCRNTGRFVI